jgi:hypothetical protein
MNNITINISSPIAAGTTLTITIDQVQNANEALTTSSFAIYTYYDSDLYETLVDAVTNGVTVTMTSNPISLLSIIPDSYTNN